MMLEISELLLPAIVIQILQSIKELVCHTFDKKKLYPKTSAGNTRPITASDSFVAQTRRYWEITKFVICDKFFYHRDQICDGLTQICDLCL